MKKYLLIIIFLSKIALASVDNNPYKNVFIGYKISNSASGKTILQSNSKHVFRPASVNKLFVSLAILESLGPDFRYQTLLTTNKPSHNNSYANVILNMQQDPSFKRHDLQAMLAHIKNSTITGDFIISGDNKKLLSYPPGWLWDDLSFGFASPITPFLLDQDRFKLLAKGAKHIELATSIPPTIIKFDNQLYENNKVHNCKIAVYRTETGFQLRGCMQADAQHTQYVMRTLAITKPKQYLVYWIKNYMQQLHIKLIGKIHFRNLAAAKTILASHYSASLELQLRHLLAKSDNVYAEAFLKKLGHFYNTPGISDFQSGTYAVINTLSTINHINMRGLRYDDGSGLSRYNATTPSVLTQLLNAAFVCNYKTKWLQLLAEPEKANTLRMLNLKLPSNIKLHAKTGSMTGVLSLAGYMQAAGHEVISFSIFINGITQKRASRRWLKHWIEHSLVSIANKQPSTRYKLPHTRQLFAQHKHIKWNKI